MILVLCLLYAAVVSVFCVCCFLFAALWKIVHVGRWSDIGGEIVPAVVSVSVRVVRVQSMRVAVLAWTGS